MQSCTTLEAPGKGDGSRERELEKGHGFCKGEHLGILERFQEGFGGSATEGSYTSLASKEELKAPPREVTERNVILFHHFVEGPW